MLNTEYYKIIKSQEAIANKEYDSARVYINQLDESDYFSDLIKKVESIWNESQANEIPISSTDSIFLYEVACKDPLKEGAGVYIARAILDYDGWCYINEANKKSIQIGTEEQIEEQVFTISPNPSNGNFEVTSTLEMQSIKLVDLSGKIIEIASIKGNNRSLNYNVQGGVYIIHIQFVDGTTKVAKIEIQ